MTQKKHYTCDKCNSQAALDKEAKPPECCAQPMVPVPEPLDKCTVSSTAEHSRPNDSQEPCDDGRGG